MVRTLRPFIAASWHGHRDEADLPAPVREVWKQKFEGRRFQGRQSNVDLAVLDSDGRLVHWFDGFPRAAPPPSRGGRKRESLGDYTVKELSRALLELDLAAATAKEHPLKLPDLEEPGVRVFVRLLDDRMRAYRAPVVEVVALEDADWKALDYPREERNVEASALKKWLAQVYPPGVMERTSQQTKKVYEISEVEGTLSLAPAGSDGEARYALLRGEVKFTDEGPGDFSYEGRIEIVLSYGLGAAKVRWMRGVFDGVYPRASRAQQSVREIPLRAVFESRPGTRSAPSRDDGSR